MENMQQDHAQLQAVLGEYEANKLVAETLDAVQKRRNHRVSND